MELSSQLIRYSPLSDKRFASIWEKSFIRYRLCKYFIPLCGLVFSFLSLMFYSVQDTWLLHFLSDLSVPKSFIFFFFSCTNHISNTRQPYVVSSWFIGLYRYWDISSLQSFLLDSAALRYTIYTHFLCMYYTHAHTHTTEKLSLFCDIFNMAL